MARAGRPPTPEDEQLVTVIRLMNKHVEMLDTVIRERSERDLKCVVVTEPERKVPGTDVTVTRSRVEEINYASERRKLVAELIEQALTTEALYPARVAPNVPPGPYSTVELVGISTWAQTGEPAPDRERAARRQARAGAQQATPDAARATAGGIPQAGSSRNRRGAGGRR